MNSILGSVQKIDLEKIGTKEIVKELIKYNPWLLKEISSLKKILG